MRSLLPSLGRRVARLLMVLLCVTAFSFLLISLLPGDPIKAYNLSSDEKVDELRKALGLDDPLPVRYIRWLGNFVTGDFGDYYATANATPAGDLAEGLPVTLTLVLESQLLALLLAIPMGVFMAYRPNSLFDRMSNLTLFLFLSVPTFVVAYLMKKYLAIDRSVLPVSGWTSPFDDPVEHLRSAIMPVICLSLGQIAVYARLLRSDMIATLQEDFVTMAKAKGVSNQRVLFRHALRPSSLTLLTVAGLNLGTLIGGTVVMEQIFRIPGLGYDLIAAILKREYIGFQSFIAVIGVLFVLINFVVDLLYMVLDPRIRDV